MKLPNYDQAVVSQVKITGILLSMTRPEKRERAKFFFDLGFSAEAWEELAQALRRHAANHSVAKVEDSTYGLQYIIDGILLTPSGETPPVRSIWFVPTGESVPRFITAYPIQAEEQYTVRQILTSRGTALRLPRMG